MSIRERLNKIYEIDRAADSLGIPYISIKSLEFDIISKEDMALLEQLELKDKELTKVKNLERANNDYLRVTYDKMLEIFGSERLDNATGESETFNLMLGNPDIFIGKMARYNFGEYTSGHKFENTAQVLLYATTMIKKLEDWALIRFDLFEELQIKIAYINGASNE